MNRRSPLVIAWWNQSLRVMTTTKTSLALIILLVVAQGHSHPYRQNPKTQFKMEINNRLHILKLLERKMSLLPPACPKGANTTLDIYLIRNLFDLSVRGLKWKRHYSRLRGCGIRRVSYGESRNNLDLERLFGILFLICVISVTSICCVIAYFAWLRILRDCAFCVIAHFLWLRNLRICVICAFYNLSN